MQPRSACLLSASAIADDPRVRRQGDALAAAGWRVRAIGYGGARSPAPEWSVVGLPAPRRPGALGRALRAAGLVAGGRLPPGAAWIHGAMPPWCEIGHAAAGERADLYIANDWPMLPIAAGLARASGGAYVYDSHELATEEYAERAKWRLVNRPYVQAIERRYIAGAAAIMTVSDGFGGALQDLYPLRRPPVTIRNMPSFEAVPEHAVAADRIAVYYHGVVVPHRGLEELIESVAQWRPPFALTLRGPASEAYGAALRDCVARHGVADRVVLAPAVPTAALVAEAARADIGIFALPGDTRHTQLTLPNKVFEYVMAGLALCVTDLPGMGAVVRRYDLGRLMPSHEPAAIAAAVNDFTPAEIERYRANSRAAARQLNWDIKSSRLVSLCEDAVGGGA